MAPRALSPALNPTGYAAVIGTVYAAAVMIWNAYNHHGVISAPVIIAAVAAVTALLTRQVVTPVADPVDGAGRPLVPAPLPAAASAPPGAGASTPLIPPGEQI